MKKETTKEAILAKKESRKITIHHLFADLTIMTNELEKLEKSKKPEIKLINIALGKILLCLTILNGSIVRLAQLGKDFELTYLVDE